ncbi:unnamed protein product [Discula destructiva]
MHSSGPLPTPTAGGDTAQALLNDTSPEPYTLQEERRLVRKIDLMIIPYLAICYAFFYIDKTTLSYAAIFGIREDLDLVGTEYSWLSSMFYFGFLAWAFPANFLMQRLPIAKYLGANIFLWGVLLIAQAGSQSFAALAALRALSGAAKACADPSFMLITANTAGHTKKVVTNAFIFLGYWTGNIAGPSFFKTEEAPEYPLGIDSMIFCHLAALATLLAFRTLLSWENKRRDRKQLLETDNEQPDLDQTASKDMTDRENPNFRYVY